MGIFDLLKRLRHSEASTPKLLKDTALETGKKGSEQIERREQAQDGIETERRSGTRSYAAPTTAPARVWEEDNSKVDKEREYHYDGDEEMGEEEEEEEGEEEETSSTSSKRKLAAIKKVPKLRLPSASMKQCLVIWHIIILTISLAMVTIGFFLSFGARQTIYRTLEKSSNMKLLNTFIRLDVKPPLLQNFGKLIDEFAFAAHFYGWTFLVSTALYVSYFYHRFPFTWPLLSLFTLISVVIGTSNVLVRLSSVSQFSMELQNTWVHNLNKYKVRDTSEISLEYDYVAVWGQCCGVKSLYDFQLQTLKYISRSKKDVAKDETFLIPATCCNKTAYRKGATGIIECATRSRNVNHKTCFQVFYDIFDKYLLAYVSSLIFMLTDVFLHAFTYYKMVKRQRGEYHYDELLELERARQMKWGVHQDTEKPVADATSVF